MKREKSIVTFCTTDSKIQSPRWSHSSYFFVLYHNFEWWFWVMFLGISLLKWYYMVCVWLLEILSLEKLLFKKRVLLILDVSLWSKSLLISPVLWLHRQILLAFTITVGKPDEVAFAVNCCCLPASLYPPMNSDLCQIDFSYACICCGSRWWH